MITFYLRDPSPNSILENNVPNINDDDGGHSDRVRFFNALNNYLTWRAVMPFIGFLDKGEGNKYVRRSFIDVAPSYFLHSAT